jgi:VWFA-related protein
VRFLLSAVVLSLVVPALPVQGQDGGESPIILRTEEILLDLVVTDMRGRPVLDLRSDEIEVFDDGVKQQITSFALRRGAPAQTKTGALALAEQFREYSFILIVVDQVTVPLPERNRVLRAAERFVKDRLAPNDLVAVLAAGSSLHVVQNFTNDRTRLLAALRIATVSGRDAALGPDALKAQIASAQDRTVLGSRLDALSAVLAPTVAELRTELRTRAVAHDLLALLKVYSHIQGRKSVLLYSQGFGGADQVDELISDVVKIANRSGFVFYTVDAVGLSLADDNRARQSQMDRGRADTDGNTRLANVGTSIRGRLNTGLRRLAIDTGGVAIRNTNDLGRGFEALAKDLHAFYVISYEPSNAELDGHYHEIAVRITRPETRLRSRAGYFAVPGGAQSLLLPFEQAVLDVINDAARGKRPSELHAAIRTERFKAGSGWYVPVALSAKAPPVDDAPGDAELHALALIRDHRNVVLAKLSSKIRFHGRAERDVLLNLLSEPLILGAGSYTVVVGLRDPTTGKSAVFEHAFRLPDFEGPDAPNVSSIVLNRDAMLLSETERNGPDEDPLVFEKMVRIVPRASREFSSSRGDQLGVFFSFYGANGHEYSARLRIVGEGVEGGSRVSVVSPGLVLPGPGRFGARSLATKLPLADLKPGMYALEVEITDAATPAGSLALVRTPFRIVS